MKSIYNMMAENNETLERKSFSSMMQFKEGKISEFGDGIADITIGAVKTYFELFVVSPFRILSRSVDGFAKGTKNGVKGSFAGLGGGTIKGIAKTLNKASKGLKEIGNGYLKIAAAISPKEE